MLVLANGSLSFETNTAAVAGVPLLTASLVQENGLSKVQITLHSAGTLAAKTRKDYDQFAGW